MPNLGKLEYEIGANTRKFLGEMEKVEGRLSKTAFAMRKDINTAGMYSAAITAAGIAIGTKLVSGQLKAIDALAKTSDKLGIATEALGGLRHAAELTGVSAGTMDMALQRMTRRVAEAGQGTGEAKNALLELGLSAEALTRLSPDKQFNALTMAMGGVASQSDKVRLAMKLFDSEGVALVNTMALGSEGLADAQRAAERYGIAISRIDAAQVEAANDAITRAQAAFTGLLQGATVELAPFIESIANQFTEAAGDAEGFGLAVLDAFEGAISVVGVFADGVHGLKVVAKSAQLAFQSVGVVVAGVFAQSAQNVVKMADVILAAIEGIGKAANKLPSVDIDLSGLGAMRKDLAQTEIRIDGFQENLVSNLGKTKDELNALAMQPLPSTQIDEFFNAVRTGAEQSRIAMQQSMADAANKPKPVIAPELKSDGIDPAVREREQQEMQERLDRIAEQFMSERELELAHHTERLAFLQTAKQSQLDLEGNFDKLIEDEKKRHGATLRDLNFSNMQGIASDQAGFLMQMAKAAEQSGAQQVSSLSGAFEQISAAGSRESKKMFELNKVAGIANATISTWVGATKALELGPIAGPIAAAAIIANGLAKVNAIKSQSFGGGAGGGGNAAPSINASSPAPPVSNAGGGGQGGGQAQAITLRISGGENNQRSAVREFAEQLNQFIDDGGQLGRFAFE